MKIKKLRIIICMLISMSLVWAYLFTDYNLEISTQMTETVEKVFPTKKYYILTDEEFELLEKSYIDTLELVQSKKIDEKEIEDLYQNCKDALVSSRTNKYFNELQEKYDVYIDKMSEIQEEISKCEKQYEEYSENLSKIPAFAIGVKSKRNSEFEEIIVPLNNTLNDIKTKYKENEEKVTSMYNEAKQLADERFKEEYELMCHLVGAEAGLTDRAFVMNVLDNRRLHPKYKQTTLEGVIYASGQYECTWTGTINRTPSKAVREEVEEYLRGRIETGMPDNVTYQAKFQQGSDVWRYVSESGHYFCYY